MSNTTKQLILLINSFDGGGAERQFSILADYLPFTAIYCIESTNVYLDESKHAVHYLSTHNNKTRSLIKYLSTPYYAYKLYKQLKGKKNIQVLSVLERAHLVSYLLSFFMKIDHIMSFQLSHKSHYKGISGSVLKFIFKKVTQRSLFSIPNSYAGAIEMAELYQIPSAKITAIPNGYNFEEIQTRSLLNHESPFSTLLQQPYILCVARFLGQKAQDKLIMAFSNIKKTHPGLKLVFAGTGEKMQACIDLSMSLSLKTFVYNQEPYTDDHDVYFLGFQKNPLVLMKHASIFAFPTYYEGLPNALIEAMICGAVPVSSDCPTGPREIIAPDTQLTTQAQNYEVSPNGILIAPFDANNPDKANGVQAWTEALNYLLDHPSLVANIQSHLPSRVAEYNMNVIIEKWNQVIAQLAK